MFTCAQTRRTSGFCPTVACVERCGSDERRLHRSKEVGMNQRSLQQIVDDAVATEVAPGTSAPIDEDALVERILRDPDVALLMQGYDMHDRAEGLPDVMERDIRRMVQRALSEGPGSR